MITLGVTDLGDILARLAAHGIGHGPLETYGEVDPSAYLFYNFYNRSRRRLGAEAAAAGSVIEPAAW
jgi:hypothetical protein